MKVPIKAKESSGSDGETSQPTQIPSTPKIAGTGPETLNLNGVMNKATPSHVLAGLSSTDPPDPQKESPASSVCLCHIVAYWIPVQGSDEDMPVYKHCPIHPDKLDTEGYGVDTGFVKRIRGKKWKRK